MIYVANWKMHGIPSDIRKIKPVIRFLKQKKYKKTKVVYCPPYTILETFSHNLKNTNISLGAQDCNYNFDYGALTGSINSQMIKSVGAKYVILGHSERRNYESDFEINKKIKSAIKSNLKVIYCIGETLKEKKNKMTNKILKRQLFNGLKNLKNLKNIIIAYEPRWAIGSGLLPASKDLLSITRTIKNIVNSINKKQKDIIILYGGSVNKNNVSDIVKIKDIKGFLVGGASLNAKNFIDIISKSTI